VQQLFALLKLTAEQKETLESLLTVAKQIDQLEATIRALPEQQRTALMSRWATASEADVRTAMRRA